MKRFVFFVMLIFYCQFSLCQNTEIGLIEQIEQIAQKHKIHIDSLRQIEREFLLALPNSFEEFNILYGRFDSPLYKFYVHHMAILEGIPRNDSLFLHKLVSLSINGIRCADAIGHLWELSRFTFRNPRYMRGYCKVLSQFSREEIKSVFFFFEDNISKETQFKLSDLVLVKDSFPLIYKAYLEVRAELGIKN
jgi:hypothetical protein